MFASIHPEAHYFCYFVVLGTAKAVMLKCLDLFIIGILLFYYFTYALALMFLTCDIDAFIFYISGYCTALLKALSFIDLKPLGVCVAKKQQSDEKLYKSENKQRLIMKWQPR